MPRNCWTRCNKTFPCSFPAREKTREIESRETSKRLEKQAILALLRKMIYKPEFLGHLSGFENLKMLSEIKGSISDANIAEYMNYFDLDPEEKKPVRKYSQGMKQKLGIIQAIMENQKLLVLDEPFNALDEKSVKLFRDLLIEYKKQEKLIILTSHNKEDIESLCDHTYQIQSGQIIAE